MHEARQLRVGLGPDQKMKVIRHGAETQKSDGPFVECFAEDCHEPFVVVRIVKQPSATSAAIDDVEHKPRHSVAASARHNVWVGSKRDAGLLSGRGMADFAEQSSRGSQFLELDPTPLWKSRSLAF
jgi:hypothetical protein